MFFFCCSSSFGAIVVVGGGLIIHCAVVNFRYQVTAYVNGHDHCQQYIDDGKGVQYHTIGSAHVNSGDDSHRDTVPEGSLKWHVGLEDGRTGGFGLFLLRRCVAFA